MMSAIKTEPDSDSESHSTTVKDYFEFVAVKYEQDPLEDTHNVSAMKVRYILVLIKNPDQLRVPEPSLRSMILLRSVIIGSEHEYYRGVRTIL
jgi:hypothetical protein